MVAATRDEVSQTSTTVDAYLFASDRHAPRRRRPTDVVGFVGAATALVLLGWGASNDPEVGARFLRLVDGLPSWLSSISWGLYSASGLYAGALILVVLVRAGVSRGVARDLFFATGAVVAIGMGMGRWIDGTWPDVAPELFDLVDPPVFPGLRIALTLTVVGVLGPHLNVSIRRLGRWASGAAILGSLLLSFTTPTGALAAVAAATVGVSAVHLLFGSPEGLPPIGRLREAVHQLGVDVSEVAYAEQQAGGVGRAVARSVDGRTLDIKVVGRDAADAQRAERLWRSIWYRSSGPPARAAPLLQVEHEALGLLVAQGFGAPVSPLVAAGEDASGDALLVTQASGGTPLAALDDADDEVLDAAWRALRLLAERRFAHGGIEPSTVHVLGDAVVFVDFERCSLTASEQRLQADVVALLATTAEVVGEERAIAAARRVLGDDALRRTVPYLQDATLPVPTRRALDVGVDELRVAVTDALGVDDIPLAKLRRVTLAGITMVALAAFAANAIVSQIADIGFDVLADQVADAAVGWLVVAFCIKIAGYLTGYLSLRGIVTVPLPLGPTVLMKSATSFIGLVLPSSVGAAALTIRYLQKLGTQTSVAIAQGPLLSIVGFVIEVSLLLSTASSIGQDVDLGTVTGSVSGTLVGLAVAAAVLGVSIVLLVPRLRGMVVPPVVDALRSIRGVVTSPSRLGRVVAGELLERIVSALVLAMVAAAYGVSLPFATVVFVTVGASLLAGLAPVPGGVGVAEAVITGLLAVAGVAEEQAFAVAITYRVLTSYLPPVFGFFSMRWLTRQGYV